MLPVKVKRYYDDLLLLAQGSHIQTCVSEEPPAGSTGPPIAAALQQYQEGGIAQARQMLITWIRSHPQDIDGRNQIAWELSVRRADPELAILLAEENAKEAYHAMTLDTLAEAYWAAGKLQDAIDITEAALQIVSEADVANQFMLHLRAGMISETAGQIQDAIQEYRRAERLQSAFPPYDIADVYRGLGGCMATIGDWDESARFLERSLATRPDDPFIQALLANSFLEVKPPRLDEAERYLQSALKMAPQFGHAYLYMMDARAKAGDFAGVIEWCEKGVNYFTPDLVDALKTEPSLEPCRVHLFKVLLKYGHVSKEEYDAVTQSIFIFSNASPPPQQPVNFHKRLAQKDTAVLPYKTAKRFLPHSYRARVKKSRDLRLVEKKLHGLVTLTETRRWMGARNVNLGGRTPIEAITQGDTNRVLELLTQLEEGIFV